MNGLALRKINVHKAYVTAMSHQQTRLKLSKMGLVTHASDYKQKCKLAWCDYDEALRELLRYSEWLKQDPYAEFCSETPSAPECLVYDV